MRQNNAYIDTTIIADALLKPGSLKCAAALSALTRYRETLLPVYAIKEMKAGIFKYYAYFHNKLVQTKSLARTIEIIAALPDPYHRYRKSTSLEALSAAIRLSPQDADAENPQTKLAGDDRELADRYRFAIASLLLRSWRKRRNLTTDTIQDLDCYTEAPPVLISGLFDLHPFNCNAESECALAEQLRKQPESLQKLADAIPPSSTRLEDVRRRQVLRDLARSKHFKLTPEKCRALGDAIFAFFAPPNSVILTTNLKDHLPLAQALGKTAEQP